MFVQCGWRPGWANHQVATAVRASSGENPVGATRAERAFNRADSGVRRIRRQISIAALAARSDFQHAALHPSSTWSSVPFRAGAVKAIRANSHAESPAEL